MRYICPIWLNATYLQRVVIRSLCAETERLVCIATVGYTDTRTDGQGLDRLLCVKDYITDDVSALPLFSTR